MMKKICSIILTIVMMLQITSCGVADDIKDTAGKAVDTAKEKVVEVKDQIVDWYEQIDFSMFKKGWNQAVGFLSTTYKSVLESEQIQKISDAINTVKSDISSTYGSAKTVVSEAGVATKKWAVNTFNVDTIAGIATYSTDFVRNNATEAFGVAKNYVENAISKYYNSSDENAMEQAMSIIKEYNKNVTNSNSSMQLEEFIDEYGKENDMSVLYASIYDGQTRIIPFNQLTIAKGFLRGEIVKSYVDHVSSLDVKILEKLKERFENPSITVSVTMDCEELQAIVELLQDGEFKPEDFGITTSQIITPKYLLKQSIISGITSNAIDMALSLGPDIFSMLKAVASGNGIDSARLKEIGIDGLLSGAEGLVEGSVSYLFAACYSGEFGEQLKEISAEVIGALTEIIINAIRYGYSIATGEISVTDYSDLTAEEIAILIVSKGSGELLEFLLPLIPCAYMAGCMAGSLLATVGIQTIKSVVMEIKDGGGFEIIVPVNIVNTVNVISDKLSELDIQDKLTGLKDSLVSVANDGYIYVKSAFE